MPGGSATPEPLASASPSGFDYSPLLAELREAVQAHRAAGGDPKRCTSDLLALAAIAQALHDHADGVVDHAELLHSLFTKTVALMTIRAARADPVALSVQLCSMLAVLQAQTSLFPAARDDVTTIQEGLH